MSQPTKKIARKILLVAGLVIGSFVLLVSFALPGSNSTYSVIQNFGHFVLFVCLGSILLPIVYGLFHYRPVLAVVVTGVGLMLLGLAVELYQTTLANRQASLVDFALDAAGIVAGFLIVSVPHFLKQGRKLWATVSGCLLILLTALALKPVIPLIGFDLLRADYPVIRRFDHTFADQKIDSIGGASYVALQHHEQYGCCALRVTFKPARYSGILFEENPVSSTGRWSDFEVLNIKVFSSLPNTRQIALRINDGLHNNQYEDRYNSRLLILPGLNEVKVPLQRIARMGRDSVSGRTMNIDDITHIQIFASDIENQFTLDLLSIELE